MTIEYCESRGRAEGFVKKGKGVNGIEYENMEFPFLFPFFLFLFSFF